MTITKMGSTQQTSKIDSKHNSEIYTDNDIDNYARLTLSQKLNTSVKSKVYPTKKIRKQAIYAKSSVCRKFAHCFV